MLYSVGSRASFAAARLFKDIMSKCCSNPVRDGGTLDSYSSNVPLGIEPD